MENNILCIYFRGMVAGCVGREDPINVECASLTPPYIVYAGIDDNYMYNMIFFVEGEGGGILVCTNTTGSREFGGQAAPGNIQPLRLHTVCTYPLMNITLYNG